MKAAQALPTRCPNCGKYIAFDLEEKVLPDGGLVMRSKPCPKCQHSAEIGRLTKKGVEYRGRIAQLRAMRRRTPSQERELDRIMGLYQREMTAP